MEIGIDRLLKSITIPDSVKSIGDEAFFACKIKIITIPKDTDTAACAFDKETEVIRG